MSHPPNSFKPLLPIVIIGALVFVLVKAKFSPTDPANEIRLSSADLVKPEPREIENDSLQPRTSDIDIKFNRTLEQGNDSPKHKVTGAISDEESESLHSASHDFDSEGFDVSKQVTKRQVDQRQFNKKNEAKLKSERVREKKDFETGKVEWN